MPFFDTLSPVSPGVPYQVRERELDAVRQTIHVAIDRAEACIWKYAEFRTVQSPITAGRLAHGLRHRTRAGAARREHFPLGFRQRDGLNDPDRRSSSDRQDAKVFPIDQIKDMQRYVAMLRAEVADGPDGGEAVAVLIQLVAVPPV